MRTRWIGALATSLLLTACGGGGTAQPSRRASPADASSPSATTSDSSASSDTDATSKPQKQRVERGPRIISGDSPLGTMLFDERGQAIYLFDREGGGPRPRCYDECAVEWPPVLTDGKPVAGRGVRGELLGTTKRRGGSLQVTYHGHPLYFYANEGVGEVLCHDFEEYGGTWYVVQPDGNAAA